MDSTSIKVEPVLDEIKKENHDYNHYNKKQSYEGVGMSIHKYNIKVKSEFNYLPENDCKTEFGTVCESMLCVCKAEGIDLISENNKVFKDNKVKLEEADHQNLSSNDNPSVMPDRYLNPTESSEYDYDEEKVEISKPKLDSIMPMVNLKCDIQPLNSDQCHDGKCDVNTELSKVNCTTVGERNLNRKYKKNRCQTNTNNSLLQRSRPKRASLSAMPMNCPECKKQYSNKLSLDAHIMSRHSDDHSLLKIVRSKVHDCPLCNKQFIYTSNLNSHILSKHKNAENLSTLISCKLHECPKCKKRFINKSGLDGHIMSSHKKDQDLMNTITTKIHECPICSEKFITKTLLNIHILNGNHNNDMNSLNTVSGSKIYDCTTKCSEKFVSKSSFNRHIINRHKNDEHLCNIASSKHNVTTNITGQTILNYYFQ